MINSELAGRLTSFCEGGHGGAPRLNGSKKSAEGAALCDPTVERSDGRARSVLPIHCIISESVLLPAL
ncbi:hypothetical protein BD324DRAFT_632594, partial [Kockovaella imperatae]